MTQNKGFPVILAEKIVKILHEVTKGNVNFMNEEGIIIATMQRERLHTLHEGAKRIMSGEVHELAITAEQAEKMAGVKPGYNGAVVYEGKCIGCIGLSGDPDLMRPLQKMAAIIVQEEYRKLILEEAKQTALEKICAEIQAVSAATQEIAAGSIENFGNSKDIEVKANSAEDYLKNIDRILDVVKNIGNQTRMLGLNAAIEAARVGEQGRGFSVVAKEMERLATGSINSIKDITDILTAIQHSVIEMAEGVRKNTGIIEKQTEVLEQISNAVMSIQQEVEGIIIN